jgi:serine/threonine protein kinase
MPLDDYVLEAAINSGAISRVYRCRDEDTGECRAMKMIDLTVYSERWWRKEVEMLTRFQYVRGIVKMYEYGRYIDEDSGHTMGYIIMELCDSDIKDQPVKPHERMALVKFLLKTLYLVHQCGYVLCDLKLENIVRMGNGFRLCDMATCQVADKKTDKVVGTDHMMAPEIIVALQRKKSIVYTAEVDIWCMGCVLFEVYALEPAFENYRVNDTPDKLHRNILYLNPRLELINDEKARTVIYYCLQKVPKKRMGLLRLADVLH